MKVAVFEFRAPVFRGAIHALISSLQGYTKELEGRERMIGPGSFRGGHLKRLIDLPRVE